MSYKPTEEQLTAYLYGELSEDEMAQVKAYLDANPNEKLNLQQLNDTRVIFNELEDEEVAFPIHIEASAGARSEWQFWRPYVAVAASLLLLLGFSWASGLGISYNADGFNLGYQAVNEGLSEAEVTKMLEDERERTIENMMSYINENNEQFDNQIKSINASIEQNNPSLIYEQEKKELIDDMLELSDNLSEDYRAIMRQLIVSFSNNIESQRIHDLQNIQAAFNELEDATIGNQLEIEDELVRLSERLDAVIANLNNNK